MFDADSAHDAAMEMPPRVFEALTAPAAYKVRRLLRADEFARFCSERGKTIDSRRLRKLEQLGLFKPLLRIRRPDDVRKIEMVDATSYRDLGSLEEGEAWDGETRTKLLQFGFAANIIQSWREHGLIWSPYDGPSAYDQEIDADPRRHEAYYSAFQIWDLIWVLSDLNVTVHADDAFDGSGAPTDNHDQLAERIAELATHALSRRDKPRTRTAYGLFAQLISDRFFVETQSDGRLITVSKNGDFYDWEWEAYARTWTPDDTVALFHLEAEKSARIESQLSAEQRMQSPLSAWRSLTRFIAMEQRKKLKDKALLAETLHEMAEMHRRFHREAFGVDLPDPDQTGFRRGAIPPVAAEDPYRALEWATNRFHLNPKPKLVLIVEGQTEEAVIPELFEQWFGAPPARYGIQLRNMHGVGNATGSKRDGMSALWRLIDFLHAQQTIALVLLDREGLAGRNVAKGLPNAPSIHFPDRHVTRREYVKLWNRCFELDNFSNSEIAAAMTKLSGAVVAGGDLKACRQHPAPKARAVTIESVFEARTGRSLNKIELARELVDRMLDLTCKRQAKTRPIIRFLEFAAERAALNHQPTTEEIWEANQRSGYLGALRPGAVSRRKKRAT